MTELRRKYFIEMGKHKKKREYSSDSDASSDSEPIEKSKKHKKSSKKSKKHKSKKKKRHSSSSSNSEADAWIEKNVDKSPTPPKAAEKSQRDDWMSADKFFLPTFTKEKPQAKTAVEKASHAIYDPATSTRELNPYYKTGEGGLPSFQRPKDDDEDEFGRMRRQPVKQTKSNSGNWRKSRPEDNFRRERSRSRSKSDSSRSRSSSPEEKPRMMLPARPTPDESSETPSVSHSDFLTDEQMNTIGAKMIKAELMGNSTLAAKLKDKLERAKEFKTSGRAPAQSHGKEQVVLSITNAAGTSRPVTQREETSRRPQDRKKKNKRVETHEDGERTKYYPDDGKYDIKQMVRILYKLAII